jgi:tRNA (guanine-N7-)-methyltransferase
LRSFVRREGRMTVAQERALTDLWERYGVAGCDGVLDFTLLFGRQAPCHLEIGCGNGECLLTLAAAHPENNFLGVEVHRPGIGSLLLRAAQQGLTNLRILNGDAAEVVRWRLPAASLECIYIFFPDPWPKKRHHKRRLLQPEFLAVLGDRLQAPGRLFIATDWRDYAEHIAAALAQVPGLTDLAAPAPYAPRPAWRPLTRYERRALDLGHTVRDFLCGRAQCVGRE